MNTQPEADVARNDLALPAAELAQLVAAVEDSQLDAPTPCAGWSVRDLLAHIRGFAAASTAAATRTPFPADSPELHGELADDWRGRLPEHLRALALAWEDPQAWEGWTEAAGIKTRATVAGSAALQELLLHRWDLAQATGQPFRPKPRSVQACLDFISSLTEEDRFLLLPAETPGKSRTALREPAWDKARVPLIHPYAGTRCCGAGADQLYPAKSRIAAAQSASGDSSDAEWPEWGTMAALTFAGLRPGSRRGTSRRRLGRRRRAGRGPGCRWARCVRRCGRVGG